jgi:hypothetical protein
MEPGFIVLINAPVAPAPTEAEDAPMSGELHQKKREAGRARREHYTLGEEKCPAGLMAAGLVLTMYSPALGAKEHWTTDGRPATC